MVFAAESIDTTGYAPTYDAGTPRVAEARAVTVDVGQELTGFDVVLP